MTRFKSKEERILYLLQGLNNKLSPKFERCTGISSSRYELLCELYEANEINQSTLQKMINIDSAAITRHLKQLEADGMVSRRRNPADNRITFVRLTQEGRERIIGYKVEKANFVSKMMNDFTDEELATLDDLLNRMQNNI
ncbi:MarR family winged helix-turn-helix transcriptional regulator [Paenibacillus sinopodophylli]|uniref:MarR family winged helix-turn-helix transcriptional regulator n=1 Tax=Paenibacillus sinopodophylli TaxID=1837342 RepID=UPI00110CB822|nr:MarR family transcriptional regulator [Paenibacillus sinopodophylli]